MRQDEIITTLITIGQALSSEKDTRRLMELILDNSMTLTGADAGTLYLVADPATKEWKAVPGETAMDWELEFAIARNCSIPIHLESFFTPIAETSLSGYAVISGESLLIEDVYHMPEEVPYRHNSKFDQESGYHTRSMLCIPMADHHNAVIGVIQLMNKRIDSTRAVDYATADIPTVIQAFNEEDERLIHALAGQAAIALENSLLYRDLNHLLDEYKKQNSELIDLGKHILHAHEEERKRMAREIHDGPAQSVANLTLKTEIARKLLERGDLHRASMELDVLHHNTQKAVSEIRTIIYNLKPSHLEAGLFEALQKRLSVFSDSCAIPVTFQSTGSDHHLELYMVSTLYNILQESLNNIQKYAQASRVSVSVSVEEHTVSLNIEDNGVGFDTTVLASGTVRHAGGGFGLEGMLERVSLVRGSLDIHSEIGKGTRIYVRVPL